ncbi:death domain-containing protein 1 [Esox lucius]|nr:death domain-containing protein 1 [Esox lucius]
MEKSEFHQGPGRVERLLRQLKETVLELGEATATRDLPEGRRGKTGGTSQEEEVKEMKKIFCFRNDGERSDTMKETEGWRAGGLVVLEEAWKERKREGQFRVLRLLQELGEVHTQQVSLWRESLQSTVRMLSLNPTEEKTPEVSSPTDELHSDCLGATLVSVEADIRVIEDKLRLIRRKLTTAATGVRVERGQATDAEDGSPGGRDVDGVQGSCSPRSDSTGAVESGSAVQGSALDPGTEVNPEVTPETQADLQKERDRREGVKDGTEEKGHQSGWVTLGLTGRSADGLADIPDACFVSVPAGAAGALTCDLADALSFAVVTGSEELVSRVLRVRVRDGTCCPFPVAVAVPFRARYRGNYRDVAVKVVDEQGRTSYVRPSYTEEMCRGHKGSFAEVRVYTLGLFAVVSCLRRENYTVPRRGLSLRLSADPRVCLHYLPGCFTSSVVAQSMLQPVDGSLLASLKSRRDGYHAVLSTSPLLHITHPSSQNLRRPLTVTLPCPPNPEKRRGAGQGGEQAQLTRPICGDASRSTPTLQKVRVSLKCSGVLSSELLVLLGWKDDKWNILDKVTLRNLQNGLVSFELSENIERLFVVRLFSPVSPSRLTALAEEVEERVRCTAVNIVLQQAQADPHTALVAVLPSRDLPRAMSELRAQGYCGPAEPSLEIAMSEGEQLLVSFSGNITLTGSRHHQSGEGGGGVCERITFHSQRKNHLRLHLTEVDPFGNYSSPHYKGTALFYKVAVGRVEWREGQATPSCCVSLKDLVCKLSVTLPKKVRTRSRPVSAKVTSHGQSGCLSDSALLWLSEELSEEDVSQLVLCFRLHRGSVQLARHQAPGGPASWAYHVLALWRRALPAGPHSAKTASLARCLAKSGRPDLARELLLRQTATGESPVDSDK